MSSKPALSFAVLKRPNFRFLLLTRMFSMMALQAQAVIVGWQIYSLTHDPLMLGLTGLTEAVPALCCALFAGYIVDSVPKPQIVYRICLGILALNTIALMTLAGGFITLPHTTLLPLIYLGVFISGTTRSFIMPASFSLLARVVPRAEMSAANAWLSTGFQAASIGSPAIAGIIYGIYGPHGAWLLPASLMTIGFIMAQMIRVDAIVTVINAVEKIREPAWRSIREGWVFMVKNPLLLTAMALDMLAVLFGGAVALLPVYADQILHVGAQGVGILRAAPAMGAIFTALYLAVRPMKQIRVVRLFWVVAGFGVSIIAFGFSTNIFLSVLFLGLSGAFDSVSMVIRSTLVQLLTPPHMRGRISSVNSMFIISSNELGAFESGVLGRLLGPVPAVVLGGIGTLIVVGVTALLARDMRRTVITADEPKDFSIAETQLGREPNSSGA